MLAAETAHAALRLDAVCRSFGGLQAVDSVTLAVRPGERRALIGPNGAGKTTLFNLISGALPLTTGRISLFGRDVTSAPAHRRAALGLSRTFQITNLFPDLTVLENCLLAAQAHRRTRFAMLRPVSHYVALQERARMTLASLALESLGDAVVRNLAGVPAIVYGLLGLAVFVIILTSVTGGRSVIAGGLTMAALVMPIVVITTAESLRAVPRSIREAGFGVGATKWQVIRHHVLPYAAPGILTGSILTLSRAFGETAPLVLAGGVLGGFATRPGLGAVETLQGPYTALPLIVFNWARMPSEEFRQLSAAAILVLLAIILLLNGAAIYLRSRFEKRW